MISIRVNIRRMHAYKQIQRHIYIICVCTHVDTIPTYIHTTQVCMYIHPYIHTYVYRIHEGEEASKREVESTAVWSVSQKGKAFNLLLLGAYKKSLLSSFFYLHHRLSLRRVRLTGTYFLVSIYPSNNIYTYLSLIIKL